MLSHIQFRLLRSANEFIIDGTFKASPKFHGECCQLFVIMGIYMDNVSSIRGSIYLILLQFPSIEVQFILMNEF